MPNYFENRSEHTHLAMQRRRRPMTVVHSGARDEYQVALALEEAGLLDELVTDLFWPADKSWAGALSERLPRKVSALLSARSKSGLPSSRVHSCAGLGLLSMLLGKLPGVPTHLRRSMMRRTDAVLGRTAGRHAQQRGSGLLSCSYYGYDAFSQYQGEGILFQLHPHPASMRRILLHELESHPECKVSLSQEWELALPEADYRRLVAEPTMARHILVASSFTRSTLVENGIPHEAIQVIPYGVDLAKFSPGARAARSTSGPLRLLFVGRINQRKGIRYLIDALRLIGTDRVELTVCGRVVDDLALFKECGGNVIVRPDVSDGDLRQAYQEADLFVLPSVAEGFGQVLLESLASGTPALSTTRTAAPDLIESGRQGFVVDPCKAEPIAESIEWAICNRTALREMRGEARELAERFTWERFRAGVVSAVLAATGESLDAEEMIDREATYAL